MLAACLESLAGVTLREGVEVHLVVVDNQAKAEAREMVLSFAARAPHPTHFVHEPRRGISFARNASIEKALSLSSDWLAFIDDDEWVEPGWLDALLQAADSYGADVVCGPVKLVYPEKLPFWTIPDVYKTGSLPPEGAQMRTAATCNTLASARLFRTSAPGTDLRFPDQRFLGLRFSEDLGLSGSEDAVLFGRALQMGAKAVFTRQAVVFEAVPPSRLTYGRALQGSYRRGAMYRRELSEKGDSLALALAKASRKAASRLVAGIILGAALPLHAMLGPAKFKYAAIAAGRNFAFVAGVAAGFMGMKSNYYLQIDGY